MPKLKISRDEWLNAATYGDLDRLEAWNKSGALEIKYDPVHLDVDVPQGRAKIFDVSDTDKENALHRAIRSCQVAYVLRLLELGKIPETRNVKGETPLMQAAELALEVVVSTLIHAGHKINVQDNKGRTALSRSVHKKSVPVSKLLLEAGASVKATAENSPLTEAVRANHPELVSMLLTAGADPNEDRPHGEMGSCFHHLACNWNKEDSDQETPRRQIMRLLVRAGVDTETGIVERGKLTSMRDLFYYTPGFDITLPAEITAWQAEQLDKQTIASPPPRKASIVRL